MARSTSPPRRRAFVLLRRLAFLPSFGSLTSALALGTLLALTAPPAFGASKEVAAATPAEKSEASNLYAAAMADFEKDALDNALKGFRDSYGVVKSPNSHFMIARTLARLGRNVEAYEELEATIAESKTIPLRG